MTRLRLVALLVLGSPAVAWGQSVPAIAETGTFNSPDGKFCAEVYRGLGECNYLQVYSSASPPDGIHHHAGLLRFPQADVWGILWVPHHEHLLVFGEAGITGRPSLGLWNGGPKTRRLVAVPDADETFELKSVSADGKTAYYEDVVGSKSGRLARPKSIRLP